MQWKLQLRALSNQQAADSHPHIQIMTNICKLLPAWWHITDIPYLWGGGG